MNRTPYDNAFPLSIYNGQVPIDYDNGGGSVAVWTNGTCTGTPDSIYPSSGLATDIFGGDQYSATSTPSLSGATVSTVSTVNISPTGMVNY
jgi:hypothetical protein